MAIKSGMFNSVNGDRRYKAQDFAAYFATFISNGIFPNPSNGFQVIANGDMSVSLKAGKAWINGYYITNDSDYNLTIDVADGVLNRIDRVVLQLNFLNREIVPLVKKGEFASTPTAPTLKRGADAYEIALADIYVGKGILSISQANITDLRLNTSLCGIVHGTVDQVDTTTIFNQYQSWFNSVKGGTEQEIADWQAQQEQSFNDWFDTIKGILDGDVAANLANRLTALEQGFQTAGILLENHLTDEERHIKAREREKWNKEYNTFRKDKDSESNFKAIEKRRKDGTLAELSVFSSPNSDGNYLVRTYKEYAENGTSVIRTIVFDIKYDADGDFIEEVARP